MKIILSISFLALMGVSCAHIQSVSLTPIPKERSKRVDASVDKFIFLAFNFDNDFVDLLSSKLADQCPGGRVTGILTKDEVKSYIFAHSRKVSATGFCVK